MPVVCTPYVISDGKWKEVKNARASAELGASDHLHAERAAYGAIRIASTCYLLVQDAYPCHKCHDYFKLQSSTAQGYSIIIKVTANGGQYSSDHGFGPHGSVPCIIYYHEGKVGYASAGMRNAPPDGFPPHPDFEVL